MCSCDTEDKEKRGVFGVVDKTGIDTGDGEAVDVEAEYFEDPG